MQRLQSDWLPVGIDRTVEVVPFGGMARKADSTRSQTAPKISRGRSVFPTEQSVYGALRRLPQGLMLDVGAAAGSMTSLMLKNAPKGRVIAFEPFPGNHPFFEKAVGGDNRVTFRKSAVGAEKGTRKFLLPKTVTSSSEGTWADKAGYSSLGFLLPDDDARPHFEVEVDTIDDVLGRKKATFVKIDVQGGELEVLLGAKKSLSKQSIGMLLVEFDGKNPDILKMMFEYGYSAFDTPYLLVNNLGRQDYGEWTDLEAVPLSTGAEAYKGWPKDAPTSLEGFSEFMAEQRKLGYIQTDLVFLTEEFAHALRL